MKPICQNIVKKDSLYPLIKHHVPLWGACKIYPSSKGQLISKGLFGVFDSSKEQTKKKTDTHNQSGETKKKRKVIEHLRNI